MSEYIYGTDEHEGHWLTGDEIVRCKDCKWFDGRPNYQLCRRDMSCDEIAVFAEPDGFCAWAERRDA